ncbi:MAG: 7-carboxy-7-deazaguanine synthase [Bradymonadia bacterium]
MGYKVKELFYTLQGEGAQTGRASVFCRFTGCNLWSGREEDRNDAVCTFCDTDFVGTNGPGGGSFRHAAELASAIARVWSDHVEGQHGKPYVVFTGGEPALQLDNALVEACHSNGFEVAIETNGTKPIPSGIDWICVSPKANQPLVVESGDEIKLVFPQQDVNPERYLELKFDHFYLQPKDTGTRTCHVESTIDYCRANPRWRLSIQTHKIVSIP